MRHAFRHLLVAQVVLDELGREDREIVRPQHLAHQQLAHRVFVSSVLAPDARQA